MHASLMVLLAVSLMGAAGGRDTLPESPPAPLLIPGRPSAPDSARLGREAVARRQYAQGLELESKHAYAAAIASYRLALRNDPGIPEASFRIGKLFLRVNQIGEAVKAFAAEVEHHPGNTEAARELGLGLAQLGEHSAAIAQLELLTRRDPADGESWRALSFAYRLADRPADAETAIRRAIALPPETAAEHRDLGFVLASAERKQEARAEYRRAIAMDSLEAGACVNLANLDRAEGDLESALAGYREAEKRDSSLAFAIRGQAQILQTQVRNEEAVRAYRRLLSNDRGGVASRLEAMRLCDALGRKDVALELARDGVRFDSESGEARLLLGMALQAQGQTRQAALEVRRGEALFPDARSKERARRLLAELRTGAPDSVRALFAADSVALAKDLARYARARRAAAVARSDSAAGLRPQQRVHE